MPATSMLSLVLTVTLQGRRCGAQFYGSVSVFAFEAQNAVSGPCPNTTLPPLAHRVTQCSQDLQELAGHQVHKLSAEPNPQLCHCPALCFAR